MKSEAPTPSLIINTAAGLLFLTHDTTLPLKHGSLALSSEISSFTTLKNRERKSED